MGLWESKAGRAEGVNEEKKEMIVYAETRGSRVPQRAMQQRTVNSQHLDYSGPSQISQL